MALCAGLKRQHEGPRAEVNTFPAHRKGSLPVLALALHKRAAATDTGVVKQQIDMLGLVLLKNLVTKLEHLRLVAEIANVRGHASFSDIRQTPSLIHVG